MTRIRRPRRCQLAVPGSNPRMMEKAAASGADHVFLDLEDAVAPSAKVDARNKVIHALNSHNFGKTVRCVRINDLRTSWCFRDIIAVVEGAGGNLDTILVPKVMSAADVQFVSTLLDQIEGDLGLVRRIGIEVLIEEVEALQNVEMIARASPRLEALVFGMGDYSASHGVDIRAIGASADAYPGDIWHYARFRLVMAARAAGIDPIDGPYANFRNHEGYAEECRRAATIGMVGKWAIHPDQVRIATAAFSPKGEDIGMARRMADEYAKAEAAGLGSVSIDGMMVDAASIRILRGIIDKADLYQL